MKLVRSVVYHWKHGGARPVLAGFMRRARSVVHRSIDATVYLAEELNIPPDPPQGITVRHPTFDDLIAGRHFKTLAYPELIRARFDQGHRCIGVYCEESLAHVAWLTVGRLPIDPGIPDIVAEGLGGAFDGSTLPEFRGRGCLTFAVQEICTEAYRLGLTRVLAVMHHGNAASRHVHEKLGFRYIGELRFRRTLWRRSFDHPLV